MSDEELQVAKLQWELERQESDREKRDAALEGRLSAGARSFSRLRGLLWAGLVFAICGGAGVVWRASALNTVVEEQGKHILKLREQADDVKVKQIELKTEVRSVNKDLVETKQMVQGIETKLDSALKARKR